MQAFNASTADVERELARIWSHVLRIPAARIDVQDHFFSLGGDSLLMTRVMALVNARYFGDRPDDALAISDFFTHGTVRSLAAHIASELVARRPSSPPAPAADDDAIAVIGMACRFPGAPDTDAFWRNLRAGVESIRVLSEAELRDAGVAQADLDHPRYVRAASFVEGVDRFDADYFGLTPREAALLSPEQRLLIECSEEALQDAGHGARSGAENVGVFVGTGTSSYLLEQAAGGVGVFESAHGMALFASNTSAATRVAYLLDLTGPALTIDTACSSSLVAIHSACRALLSGECDMALAGGATVRRFDARGYFAEEGGIFSSDGHCRPFDVAAQGTVSASGAGMVLLKRRASAIAEGDPIHAVIRGIGINNDGGSKAAYSAPSAAGQAGAIRRALAAARLEPFELQYLETHGTGTALGDQIEIAALKDVFARSGSGRRYTLGTVKANVGHLEAAAGIAGFIKVALALSHREMPPAIHSSQPAPALGLEKSGFTLNSKVKSWPALGGRRRAGVSSFGVGGTNAHAVLEEHVRHAPAVGGRRKQLLVVSAHSESALRESARRLARRMASDPELSLCDVAYTLQVGRAACAFRGYSVASETDEAVRNLEAIAAGARPSTPVNEAPQAVFMFPGQGCQQPGMFAELYAVEPVFREQLDRCSQILRPHLSRDLQEVLQFPADTLAQTMWSQPALFAVEYSFARLWQSWGVNPSLMIGHSLGEYVAACIAGVFTLEDALRVVAVRGRLMQGTAAGKMLVARLSADVARGLLPPGCSLAAVNGPQSCTIAGPAAAVEQLEARLTHESVPCKTLATSHAFHSSTMDEIVEPFGEVLRGVAWGKPDIPFLSNATGAVVRDTAASSPRYWLTHLRETVNFHGAIQSAAGESPTIFLEVGPGTVLSGLVRAMSLAERHAVLASETTALLHTAGQLWQRGVAIDWRAFDTNPARRRVSLPTYPFERQRHWIGAATAPRPRLGHWFHVPVWREQPRASVPSVQPAAEGAACCVLIGTHAALENALTSRLETFHSRLVTVPAASEEKDYADLFASLETRGWIVTSVIHAAEVSEQCGTQESVYSLMELCKALSGERRRAIALTVITRSAYAFTADEAPDPRRAMLTVAAGVVANEFPEIACRSIDFGGGSMEALVDEILSVSGNTLIMLRGGSRWERAFEKLPLPPVTSNSTMLRGRGVYLVTGALGGIGGSVAEFLARTLQARLVLVSRREFPLQDIQKLEALGAEVRAVTADVTRAADIERVVAEVRREFGELHGLIHAAGVPGGGMLFLKTREMAERVMAPKVVGTSLLYDACKDLQPRFFLCCSSLAAIVAPVGQFDYCAANAYQDAFCRAHDDPSATRCISINWDAWKDVGMAVDAGHTSEIEDGISCEEGLEVFQRVLANPRPQWIIDARGSLQSRGARCASEKTVRQASAISAPTSSLQGDVATIWGDLLGVEAHNGDDDFFALGGDSLLAVELRTRLEARFSRPVSLRLLLSEPTLAGMARLMEGVQP
jgi:acyl transferase domain-containing protein/acyl carrier protein